MSNGQGSSPQAEAIQKKMDALMTRYLTMKAALLVQSAIDNSMLLCAASGSWMVQLALSLDQVCFQKRPSTYCVSKERGGWLGSKR